MDKGLILAYFDSDEEYARRLTKVLETSGAPYTYYTFTKEDEFFLFLEKTDVDTIMLGDESVKSAVIEIMAGREYGMFSLSDKYRPWRSILDLLPKAQTGAKRSEAGAMSILGIYGWADSGVQTRFALERAKELASKKTLYLNLHEYAGLEEVLPEIRGQNLASALFLFEQQENAKDSAWLKGLLEDFLGEYQGFYYLAPMMRAEDYLHLTAERTIAFCSWLQRILGIQQIVLDIGETVRRPAQLLVKCDECRLLYQANTESRLRQFLDCVTCDGTVLDPARVKKVLLKSGAESIYQGVAV